MMPSRVISDERGMALAVALFALVLMGALVTGTFFAGLVEQQSGRNAFFAAQAAEAAEGGINDALSTATPGTLGQMAIGQSAAFPDLQLGTGVSSTRAISRLTGSLFLIRATGTRRDAAGTPLALRTLGLLVRLSPGEGSAAVAPLLERSWLQLY
jgi:hypothetical protein